MAALWTDPGVGSTAMDASARSEVSRGPLTCTKLVNSSGRDALLLG